MKKLLILFLTFIVISTLSAQKAGKSNTYKITGTVSGFTDSTVIYLSDLSDGSYRDIDSIFIFNNKFVFEGKLNRTVENFAVHTKGYKDRVSFWIDNSETFITAEKGKFKEATIIGSKAQAESQELNAIISISKNEKLDYIAFIQKNKNSIISAYILSLFSTTWNKDTISLLYNQLSPTAQKTTYGKNVFDFLTLNKNPQIGNRYVDFEQQNVNDETIKLSDFDGKIVLLEFWGSWCAPCREGHPELIKTYNEFKDKGFEILGVAAETDKKRFADAIQKDGLPWHNLTDLKGDKNKVALIYGISYYPANYLIDKNGIIVAKDLRGEKLRKKLLELLQ